MFDTNVLVACFNSNGIPTLLPVTVRCTVAQYENGDHYQAAVAAARESDHEAPYMAIDFNDAVPSAVFGAYRWPANPVIDLTEGGL